MRIISKSGKLNERHYEMDEDENLGITLCGLDFIKYSVWEKKQVNCIDCIRIIERIEKEIENEF